MRKSLAAALVLAFVPAAWGDTIWTGSGAGRGLEQEVDVQGAEDLPEGEVLVYLVNGNRATTPMARVRRIELDADGPFSKAEEAFAGGDWTAAADLYGRAADRGSSAEWIKRRSVRRLVESAAAAGLFDRAVEGFVRLVSLDPTSADAARPRLGAAVTEEQLAQADQAVAAALQGRGLDDAGRKRLLAFRLEVANARGDDAAAAATIKQLGNLLGEPAGDVPEAERPLYAQVLLGRANLALQQGEAERAASLITGNGSLFTQPADQAAAMLALARAAEATAQGRDGQLDAALAYMKVVALFGDGRDVPAEVPTALLAAARLHEVLGLGEDARTLYREVVDRHGDSPQAVEAQGKLDAVEE